MTVLNEIMYFMLAVAWNYELLMIIKTIQESFKLVRD
jgi:hypothetical protein